MVSFNTLVVSAVQDTGHPEFQEITFPEVTGGCLLVNMPEQRIKGAYDYLKWKAFGWSVNSICYNQIVNYQGDTIFAKANNTTSPLRFTYNYGEKHSISKDVETSWDTSIKVSGKIKAISAGLDGSIRQKIGKKTTSEKTESTELIITIPPKVKLVVSIRGEARLNNGVGVYYLFGIPVKKGEWEYIDIVNEYCDFYETKIY